MFCPGCGSPAPEEAAFCPKCGGALPKSAPPSGGAPGMPPGGNGAVPPPSAGWGQPGPVAGGVPGAAQPTAPYAPPGPVPGWPQQGGGGAPGAAPQYGMPPGAPVYPGAPGMPGAAPWGAPGTVGRVGLKRVSVGLMILWGVLSLGIYLYAWLQLRIASFNAMGRSKLPSWIGYLLILLQLGSLLIGFLPLFAHVSPEEARSLGLFSWIPFLVGLYVWFTLRRILKEYAERLGGPIPAAQVANNPVMTFFFGPLYMQYHINKMIEARMIDPR